MVNVAEPPLAAPGATLILEDSARTIADSLLKPALKQGLVVNYFTFNKSQADLGKPIPSIDDNEIKFELTNGYFEIQCENGEVIHITSSLQVAEALAFPTQQETASPHAAPPKLAYKTIALDWLIQTSIFVTQETSNFAAKLLPLRQPLQLVLISENNRGQKQSILSSYTEQFQQYYHESENPEISIILKYKTTFFSAILNRTKNTQPSSPTPRMQQTRPQKLRDLR